MDPAVAALESPSRVERRQSPLAHRRGSDPLPTLIGFILLACWMGWWITSVANHSFVGGQRTWVRCWHWPGADFDITYYAVQEWAAGGDPYVAFHTATNAEVSEYEHPPIVLWLFAWCRFLTRDVAYWLWTVALAAMATLAATAAWHSRRSQGLLELPLPLCVAMFLCSYPFLFELERGNWNLLAAPGILLALWLLNRDTPLGDAAAGLTLGAAAWIKIYPAFMLLGIAAAGRWRSLVVAVATIIVIGLADLPHTRQFLVNVEKITSKSKPDVLPHFQHGNHTISGSWNLIARDLHVSGVKRIPGAVGGLLVILPLAGWVCWRARLSPDTQRLMLPLLMWLTAAGSYLPDSGNDYSLVFLPLAAMATWDRRDPVWMHVLMASLLIWCQPFALPLSPRILFYAKFLSLAVVGMSLARRAGDEVAPLPSAI